MTDAGFAEGSASGGALSCSAPPDSIETKLSVLLVVKLISKHYYISKRRSCLRAKRRNSCCWWGGSQAHGYDGELSPAQWMALLSFARANSFSLTPSAFAEFQATIRGTASQAIKALEAGGYLVRQRSPADGRSVTLRLTDKGHEVVARDPFEVLVHAVDLLNAQEQTAMRDALYCYVLTRIAASGAHQHFGVCQDCAYLGGKVYCDLTRASQLALGCQRFR